MFECQADMRKRPSATSASEPPKKNGETGRSLLVESEPLPLPQLREGRGNAPSQGDVIEAEIPDASGRAVGKVMLETLEVSPSENQEFSREWLAQSWTKPFRSLVWGRSGRSSWFTSARLRNLEGAKRREPLFIVGSGQLSQQKPIEDRWRQAKGPTKA